VVVQYIQVSFVNVVLTIHLQLSELQHRLNIIPNSKAMKKTLSIFCILTVVSSAVFAGGIDDPKNSSNMAVMKKGTDGIRVFYKNSKATNVQVSIYDKENKLKFTEVIRKSEGFSRPYDLSKLAAGEYTIEMKDGDRTLTEKVNTNVPTSTFVTHVIRMKGVEERYLVTVADKTSSSLTIQIQNADKKVVLEYKDEMDKQYAKVFRFNGKCDDCTFTITNDKGEVQSIDN
jgi:hypothetical protein